MLLRLLASPITAPLRGARWAADVVLRAAEDARAEDRARVAAEIALHRRAHARGEIDDTELERRIRPLLDRAIASTPITAEDR